MRHAFLGLLAGGILVLGGTAFGQFPQPTLPPISVNVQLKPVASGLTSPVDLSTAPGGNGDLYVTDQTGEVRVISNGALQSTPFLDVRSRLVNLSPGYDERGLLGFAFDPNYNNPAAPGYHTVYTYTSEPVSGTADFTEPLQPGQTFNNQAVVAAWQVGPSGAVDPSTRKELLRIDHPQSNHNAGHMAFGPDGDLYFTEGDGGNANDVGAGHNPATGNGQDTSVILGKVLRLDVHGNNSANGKYGIPSDNPFAGQTGKVQEIYAYGLRNPYRFSFDKATGKLVLADVGQNTIEEVNYINKGLNYGWPVKEGTFTFDRTTGNVIADSPGAPAGLTDPVAEYNHTNGIAVIGGEVYRGSLIPQLQGQYVFGDLSTAFGKPDGHLFFSSLTGDPESNIKALIIGNNQPLGYYLKGFGQDDNGELYVLVTTALGPTGSTGMVFELVPEPSMAGLTLLALGSLLMLRRKREETLNAEH